jgi:protein TonB
MFDQTLLDSSPSRAPLLNSTHYFCVAAGGAMASLAWFLARARLFSAIPIRTSVTQSLLIGTLVAAFVLMVSYVYAESRRLALNAAFWVALTCVLNVPGFVGFLIYTAARTGDWKRAAVPCAYGCEALLVAALALVPLVDTEALPKTAWLETLSTPVAPPAPRPSLAAATPRQVARSAATEAFLREPTVIPRLIAQVHDEPPPPAQFPLGSIGIPGAIGSGQSGAGPDTVLEGILRNSQPLPPPPQPPTSSQAQRIRVGGSVIAARLIYQPKPEYPVLARTTRTQGDVEFEAVISREGTIEELKVIKGHPLLVKAALDAVRQWRYRPTLLNGEPIEVVTEIVVNFRLTE